MRKFIAFGPALVVLITALVTLVAAPAAVRLISYAGTDSQIVAARQDLEQDNILKQIDKAVRNIADAVEPSVVHVGVIEAGTQFGGVRRSQGSGWVFDKDGHIITNAHVVRNAARITVQFNDGRAADATVVGADASTDIAVLSVPVSEGLFPVQRATGLELHQGDRVYAFGSPFGFKFSMSEGIVSGLGRDPEQLIGNREGYTNFIQTDAAVNPGNSGGPLVNIEGKLVGMNVAIATATTQRGVEGQNSGISFAIPLSTIERVVEQLTSGGFVTRGFLGISRPMNDEENLQLLAGTAFRGRGVIVKSVEPADGPAARGGLLADDVITRLNNQAVTNVPVLRSAIANNSPGDKISVEVWRNGETKKLEVVLGRLVTETDRQEAARAAAKYGIVDVAETSDGKVFITRVRLQSAAYQAGMRPNQRVVQIDGTPVRSLDQFFTTLAAKDLQQGKEVPMVLEGADGDKVDLRVSGK